MPQHGSSQFIDGLVMAIFKEESVPGGLDESGIATYLSAFNVKYTRAFTLIVTDTPKTEDEKRLSRFYELAIAPGNEDVLVNDLLRDGHVETAYRKMRLP